MYELFSFNLIVFEVYVFFRIVLFVEEIMKGCRIVENLKIENVLIF